MGDPSLNGRPVGPVDPVKLADEVILPGEADKRVLQLPPDVSDHAIADAGERIIDETLPRIIESLNRMLGARLPNGHEDWVTQGRAIEMATALGRLYTTMGLERKSMLVDWALVKEGKKPLRHTQHLGNDAAHSMMLENEDGERKSHKKRQKDP